MDESINLINFTDLKLDEKKMILSWRNHPNVKEWMYDSNDIPIENHLSFIESLKDSKDKQYFIVKQDKEYIGVIDFTEINNPEIFFGLYSNPNAKIAGVGRILEKVCINYAMNILNVDTLKLEVFSDNIQVRNLHKKFNFKETGKKIINNKEVICMELKNENR
jgi:UDP-4-amino-4,6-dideoxy-N-acetyl-beta-L-altrosamine N-acetyltransferase